MALKNRIPLQVDPQFKKKLDDIQKKIMMAKGQKVSLREITNEIISSPLVNDIENSIIKAGDVKMDIRLRFDRRILQ